MRFKFALQGVAALATCSLFCHPAAAQVASVDVSDTGNPQLFYDEEPDLFLPNIPEDVLKLYLPSPEGTANAAVSAAQKQNAIAIAAIALGGAGVITGTAGVTTDPIVS